MKKLILIGLMIPCLYSCAIVATPVGYGGIYTNVTSGQAVTENESGTKVGRAKAKNILGFVATGDASIQAAAREGGITKITHVDYHQRSILGVFATCETIVYGE